MKSVLRPVFAVFAFWMALAMAAPAQNQPSLADLARQTRAKKEQESKSAKEFTNDTIPMATISAAPAPAPSAETPAGEAAAAEGDAAGEDSAEPTMADLEKEYREKFATLKQTLDTEERRLDVLQRELNLAQQQFYSDPNVAMREQYSREEINKRTEEINAQKAKVEDAKKAIADLETELREKSLPPGWAR